MLSHETDRVPLSDLNFLEKVGHQDIKACYRMLATDYDNQKHDPELYPGLMPDEQLVKLPPTIVWTSEFDMLRRDAVAFINRMKDTGAPLLDQQSMAGGEHGYENAEAGELRDIFFKTLCKAWQVYVTNQVNSNNNNIQIHEEKEKEIDAK